MRVVAEVQRDAIEPGTDPDDLTRRAQDVQVARAEAGYAAWKDVALPQSRGQSHPLQRNERLAQALAASDPVPRGKKAAERRLLRGLDLTAQHRERRAPDAAENVRVAPLALRAAGPELPADERVRELEGDELLVDGRDVELEPRRDLRARERAMRLRVPSEHSAKRVLDGLEKDLRHSARRDDSERVAHESSVLDRDEQLARAEPHANGATLAQERLGEPAVVLAVDERAGAAQQVVELIDVARRRSQRRLDLLDRAEVEQLAQLLDAHELAEKVAVERQRLRAAFLRRRVVLVHVRGHVVEEERRGERRRRRRLDLHDSQRACLDPAEDPAQRRQVEDVLQALPVRLEHDRELRIAARDLEEVLRLQPLLPERRALARTAPGDEQRARGVLAEPRAVQR